MSTSSFASFRSSFETALNGVVEAIELRRQQRNDDGTTTTADLTETEKAAIVDGVVLSVGDVRKVAATDEAWRSDVRRGVIDRGLEEMVLGVALRQPESTPDSDPAPYAVLADLLDIILTFAERELADAALPVVCISALLDIQTISGCAHIFSYLESRVDRLIVDMNPTRGKGLFLLRLLNELLRRLPRSKTEHVVFCGRILMFLSSSFPLGEKSGVNLRGNFNTAKVTDFELEPTPPPAIAEPAAVIDITDEVDAVEKDEPSEEGGAKMEDVVEEEEGALKPEESKETVEIKEVPMDVDAKQDFYVTFWSLQRFFTNPPSLFQASTTTDAFAELKDGISQTLDAFALATKREKELLGSGKEGGERMMGKRKEEAEDEEEVKHHYFFPKFLTSRNLLELEIADPTFRRQILIQCLVLFQYLLAFTPVERMKWTSLPGPIPSSQQSYELSNANEQWINELRTRTTSEMEAMQGGARFRQTVELILHREQNWINWKLTSCQPFGLPPIDAIAISSTSSNKMRGVVRKLKAWPYKIGNPVLSKLWDKNTTSMEDFGPETKHADDFDNTVRDWRMTKKVIAQRQGQLSAAESSTPVDAGKVTSFTNQLEQLEKKIKSLHWRAIRIASSTYLHLFHRIHSGELDELLALIEAERVEKEERAEKEALGLAGLPSSVSVDTAASSTDAEVEGESESIVDEGLAKAIEEGSAALDESEPQVEKGKEETAKVEVVEASAMIVDGARASPVIVDELVVEPSLVEEAEGPVEMKDGEESLAEEKVVLLSPSSKRARDEDELATIGDPLVEVKKTRLAA